MNKTRFLGTGLLLIGIILNLSFEYEVHTSSKKDSLEITKEEDSNGLAKLIQNHKAPKFIIRHETDTMMKTVTFLKERIKAKLIVITGAMRPVQFSNSETFINEGCAIATVNLMDKGVFIAMHGFVKTDTEIKRDLETGKHY